MRKSILKELIVRHFTYEDLLQGEATLGVVEVLAHHQPSSTANPQLLLVAQCSLVDIQPFFHELEKEDGSNSGNSNGKICSSTGGASWRAKKCLDVCREERQDTEIIYIAPSNHAITCKRLNFLASLIF